MSHPSAEVLKGKDYCFLCEDSSSSIEADLRGNDYEMMSQHIEPGIHGINTRRKYQRLLKRHGLTDDVPHKDIVSLTRDTGKRDRIREEAIGRIVNNMADNMRRAKNVPVLTEHQNRLRKNIAQWIH